MADEVKPKEKDLSLEELYARQEQAKIDFVAKTDPTAAKGMQMVLDNPNKTIFMDTRDGAKITVFDGDKETIKPFLASKYEQSVEKAGGVDALIEQRTASMKEVGMPQAAMDKEIELMRAADGDGQKYADSRFENNAFFAEQAKAVGKDPAAANDYTTGRVVTITEITISRMVDGKLVEDEKDPKSEEPSPKLAHDEKAMVPLYEDGKLTNTGALDMAVGGIIGHDSPVQEGMEEVFKKGVEEHGSLEAFAAHVKANGLPELEIDAKTDPEGCKAISEAISKSEGKPEYFSASIFKAMNERERGPEQDLEQKTRVDQEQRNTQNLLVDTLKDGAASGGGFQNMFTSGRFDIKQIMDVIMKMLSGKMTLDGAKEQFANQLGVKDKKSDGEKKDPEGKEKVAATKTGDKKLDPKSSNAEQNALLAEQANKQDPDSPKNILDEENGTLNGKAVVQDADGNLFYLSYNEKGKGIATAVPDKDIKGTSAEKKPESDDKNAENKEVASKDQEGKVISSTGTTSTGKPVVNKDFDAEKAVEIEQKDGTKTTLDKAFNEDAQGNGKLVAENYKPEGHKVGDLAEDKPKPDDPKDDNTDSKQDTGADTAMLVSGM